MSERLLHYQLSCTWDIVYFWLDGSTPAIRLGAVRLGQLPSQDDIIHGLTNPLFPVVMGGEGAMLLEARTHFNKFGQTNTPIGSGRRGGRDDTLAEHRMRRYMGLQNNAYCNQERKIRDNTPKSIRALAPTYWAHLEEADA